MEETFVHLSIAVVVKTIANFRYARVIAITTIIEVGQAIEEDGIAIMLE